MCVQEAGCRCVALALGRAASVRWTRPQILRHLRSHRSARILIILREALENRSNRSLAGTPVGSTAHQAHPSLKHAPARCALSASALMAITLVLACSGGSDDGAGSSTPSVTVVRPTVALPSVPPDSADKTGLLVTVTRWQGKWSP